MIIDKLNNFNIILASRSPRRQQLLHEMGIEFHVVIREYPETFPASLNGEETARYISREKALTLKDEISENDIVIAADTIVWCNNMILGKPLDSGDAIRILHEISGNTHEVITGVTLLAKHHEKTFCESTRVTFESLSDDDIIYYVNKFKPFDKAGAYGIQEWIGIIGCSNIEGSYFNVVGLPVQRLYKELQNFLL